MEFVSNKRRYEVGLLLRWWISTSIKESPHFYVSSHRFRVINVKYFIPCKFKSRNIQHVHRRHSMANIKLYKSHSTHFCAITHLFWDINVCNMWPRKLRLRSPRPDNIRSHAIRWSVKNINLYINVMTHFTLALIVLEMLTFKNIHLENLHQGHWIQQSQLCLSMANIKLHKSLDAHFALALTVCEILIF